MICDLSNIARNIWKGIGIAIMASLLIMAVETGKRQTPVTAPCAAITYDIDDAAKRMYLTETELDLLLQRQHIYPVGQALNTLSLQAIENAVRTHPMVRTAECYLTPRNEVKVQLTQRVPLLRVRTEEQTYFIDRDRLMMPVRDAVRDSVLLITGSPDERMATHELANFAFWLQHHRYWNERVHHVYVASPQRIYLYLKYENGAMRKERILLGEINGFESKLAKLRTFYENGSQILQDKHYTELDLRFRGQVVGR